MSAKFTSWSEVKAKAAAADPRTPEEREAGRRAAAARTEVYVRGYHLAENREAAGLTQAQVATLGDRTWKVAWPAQPLRGAHDRST